jgi:hypothetical protein
VIKTLRERNKTSEPVLIQTRPPTSELGLIEFVLLVQTTLIVVLLFRVSSLQARLPR